MSCTAMRRAHARRTFPAFTLIELIVTIVILGILAALAVPAFTSVIDRSRDEQSTTTWSAVIREAQALAAFDNRSVTADDIAEALGDLAAADGVVDAAGAPYTYVDTDADDDGVADGVVGADQWSVDDPSAPSVLLAADAAQAADNALVVASVPAPGVNPVAEVRNYDDDGTTADGTDTQRHYDTPLGGSDGGDEVDRSLSADFTDGTMDGWTLHGVATQVTGPDRVRLTTDTPGSGGWIQPPADYPGVPDAFTASFTWDVVKPSGGSADAVILSFFSDQPAGIWIDNGYSVSFDHYNNRIALNEAGVGDLASVNVTDFPDPNGTLTFAAEVQVAANGTVTVLLDGVQKLSHQIATVDRTDRGLRVSAWTGAVHSTQHVHDLTLTPAP